jgi:hypothetical protein
MKLQTFRFLWKQFCGPQVTAIVTALFHYIRNTFNNQIEYLSTFSIKTASDAHLTLIGALLGIIRPIIRVADLSDFIFTTDPETGKDYGVSEAPGPSQLGGKFTDLYADMRKWTSELCPAEYFRQILLTCARSNAHPMSPVFISEFLDNLFDVLFPTGNRPVYTFTWIYNIQPDAGIIYEDMRLDLGSINDWGTPDTAAMWQGVLSGIINNIWNPEQHCQVTFSQ